MSDHGQRQDGLAFRTTAHRCPGFAYVRAPHRVQSLFINAMEGAKLGSHGPRSFCRFAIAPTRLAASPESKPEDPTCGPHEFSSPDTRPAALTASARPRSPGYKLEPADLHPMNP